MLFDYFLYYLAWLIAGVFGSYILGHFSVRTLKSTKGVIRALLFLVIAILAVFVCVGPILSLEFLLSDTPFNGEVALLKMPFHTIIFVMIYAPVLYLFFRAGTGRLSGSG